MSPATCPTAKPAARGAQASPMQPQTAEKNREATLRLLLARAMRLYESKMMAEAEEICLKILAIDVRHADGLYLLGMVGYKTERYPMAERMIRRAIAVNDRQPFYHANLGNALYALERPEEAIACFKRALELHPEHLEARFNLGNAHGNKKEYAQAEECYKILLKLKPDHAEGWNNLGNVQRLQDRPEEALQSYLRALKINPNLADTCSSLGSMLHEQWKIDEAVALYKRALALNPSHFKAANCLANGRYDQGDLAGSVAACKLAMSLKENFYDAQMNHALLQLLQGDYANGWETYEVRWKVYTPRVPDKAPWNGEPLNGATILLHAEQGLGDTLQFIRYVPMVVQAGGKVYLDLPQRLRRLAELIPGITTITNTGDPVPVFQTHAPLMSLPRAFKTTLETIPHKVPYLLVPQAALDKAAALSWPEHGLRVGLCWGGSPTHPKNRARAIPLKMLEPLFDLENVNFFSLQMGPSADELKEFSSRIIDLAPATGDMADTAAQIKNLDLVLTIDTSIAHLAGALGHPMWVLTAFLPDWRWLMEREDCPWYPSARLLRQPKLNDWKSVVERTRAELQVLAGECKR